MNNIQLFVCDIITNMCNSYLYASSLFCDWLLYQIWTKPIHSFLRYRNKHIQFKNNIDIITKIGIVPSDIYKLKQHIVHDKCTKYEQIHSISQQTLNIYEKNCHNYSNLAHSQILFYLHQQTMVPDHGTQYEENPSSHQWGMHEDGYLDRQTDHPSKLGDLNDPLLSSFYCIIYHKVMAFW